MIMGVRMRMIVAMTHHFYVIAFVPATRLLRPFRTGSFFYFFTAASIASSSLPASAHFP